eukprot:s2897_g14.t1
MFIIAIPIVGKYVPEDVVFGVEQLSKPSEPSQAPGRITTCSQAPSFTVPNHALPHELTMYSFRATHLFLLFDQFYAAQQKPRTFLRKTSYDADAIQAIADQLPPGELDQRLARLEKARADEAAECISETLDIKVEDGRLASLCANPDVQGHIDLHEVGLGDSPTHCKLTSGTNNVGDGIVNFGGARNQAGTAVETSSEYEVRDEFDVKLLDEEMESSEFAQQKVAFVKIDVEGFECHVW